MAHRILSVFLALPAIISAVKLANRSQSFTSTYTNHVNRALNPSAVTATILSEANPINPLLFGAVGPTPAPSAAFQPYVHPRIINSASDWDQLLERYADESTFNLHGSWSRYHRTFTLNKGPLSPFIDKLIAYRNDSLTDLYTGSVEDLSLLTEAERTAIKPLADKAAETDELNSGSFFMCAFWASVSQKRAEMYGESARFLPVDIKQKCINATVTWAKIMLAHRAYYCNPTCPTEKTGGGHWWNFDIRWEVQNDWFTASSGMGLSYDVLYHDMTEEDRTTIRSALALLVMKRFSWGNSITSDRISPNAMLHPHRIFSNWALYHSNLYIANLAIEKDTGFDAYASAVLAAEGETGFNTGLNTRFEAMIEAFLAHSVYGDGSTFEDGYTYFIALREGSLGLVAAHRRGIATLDTPRFRNLIHNALQMYEPWMCGEFIGHASGGGVSYPAHIALFRYAYPDGPLTTMLWKKRMHPMFRDYDPCRIEWFQNMAQLTFFGAEHRSDAESLEGLDEVLQDMVPKSYYSPRRGLLIARSSHQDNAVIIHFDARPDAFFPGHDNADRGVITYSSFKKTWLVELPWRENVDSRKHSLMHVDGLAQDEKAPCARMMKVLDDGAVVLAAANLTYAYNVQWARNWPHSSPPDAFTITYHDNGTSFRVHRVFSTPEFGNPRDFGWPEGDDGADIGFTRPESNLHGDEDVGFRGMWTWKRDYRTEPLAWAVRSTALVRSPVSHGYFLIADSFEMRGTGGMHTFESYMIIADDAIVVDDISSCVENTCLITLNAPGISAQVDIHVLTLGTTLSYRREEFDGHQRLVVKSENMQGEEFLVAFNAHEGDDGSFSMSREPTGELRISKAGNEKFFRFADETHELVHVSDLVPSMLPTRTASPTLTKEPSSSASESPSPSGMVTPMPTATFSATASVMPSNMPPPTVFPSATVTPMPGVTFSGTVSPMPSIIPSSTAIQTATASPTPKMDMLGSVSPSVASSPAPSSSAGVIPISPSPIGPIVPPMEPIELLFKGKVKVKVSKMNNKTAEFLHQSNMPLQQVFNITARTPPRRKKRADRLETCSKSQTNVATAMAIYDCGSKQKAYENYLARKCRLVAETGVNDVCRQFRTNFRRRLTKGIPYFVVVSVEEIKKGGKFQIKHSLGNLAPAEGN